MKEHITVNHPIKEVAVQKSGYISWDQEKCVGCSECLTACALKNDSGVNPSLSGIIWHDEQESYNYAPRKPLICQQCTYPECYYLCTMRAIEIDENTGARYINEQKCNGCGICVLACPFEEPRVHMDINNKIAIKCDLCRDRQDGPLCTNLCPTGALTLIPAEGRI